MTKRQPKNQSQHPEGDEWPQRLGRMSIVVDAWRKRAENPTTPEPNSSLAADSMEGLGVESQVWYAMCISSEHLAFTIGALKATGTMYPTAYMTVARTALVAAVNAVWILAPTARQERRVRALRLRADDLRIQVTSLRDIRVPDGEPAKARDGLLEQLRDRQARLQEVATAAGITEDVTKTRFNQTKAVDWVAEHTYGLDGDLLIGAMQAVWRSGSAAAHGQYHFGLTRFDRSDVMRETPTGSIVRLRGDLASDVGPALAAATMTLSEAFRLYDLRSASHDRATSR